MLAETRTRVVMVPSCLRHGYGGRGAGDETRTRDVLLGKEVLYH